MYYSGVTARLELWLPIAFFTILWVVMQWHGKMPAADSIQKFVSVINSRGGNIIVLLGASIYFFKYSMYLFFDLITKIGNKTITPDNAIALMAIQFITTSAFGGAMGALLKTMTGESSTARKGDSSTGNNGNGNGNGDGSSQTNSSSTITTSKSTVTSSIPGILPVTNASNVVATTTNSSSGF